MTSAGIIVTGDFPEIMAVKTMNLPISDPPADSRDGNDVRHESKMDLTSL